MVRSIIYTVDATGSLTAMRPDEPRSEDSMQKLVAAHPVDLVGPLTTDKLNGLPAFPAIKLNEPAVQKGLVEFLNIIRALGSSPVES